MLRFCFICLLILFVVGVATARADDLHLKDGRVIEAERVWEADGIVWYRQGKIIASVAKADVVRVTKAKAAPVVKAAVAKKPEPEPNVLGKTPAAITPVEPSASGDEEAVTRQVARIVLRGGTQIDADSVWETDDRIGYRLGKMQSFVDRADVVRVVRDLMVTETTAPQLYFSNLRYSTGNRGLDQLIAYNSQKYGVDPTLIYLVMREESGFRHNAVSRVGARGLMQLMPATAARLGVRNIHDPVQNVDAGVRYLRSLLQMFKGDMNLTLAAYNAGEGAVVKYGHRVPPYRETQNYVWRINTAYRRAIGQ